MALGMTLPIGRLLSLRCLSSWLSVLLAYCLYLFYALPDPCHDWHCHAVAQGFVARAIRRGFIFAFDVGVVVGEALESLAFCWRESSDGHGLHNALRLTATSWGLLGQRQRLIMVVLWRLLCGECHGLRHRMTITFGQRVHWLTRMTNAKAVAFTDSLLAVLSSMARSLVMDRDWLHHQLRVGFVRHTLVI